MPSRSLDPDTMLSVQLSAICSRNQYTKDPGPVIAELRETAGESGRDTPWHSTAEFHRD